MIRLAESILATPRRFSALHRLILASLAVTLAMASPSGVWAAEPSEAGRFLESASRQMRRRAQDPSISRRACTSFVVPRATSSTETRREDHAIW
jgi:hypothetical protein